METNYIGKICPFCKTEIKEGDAVKVCPVCEIPHHEGCWEENKGCTTFGCEQQYQQEQPEITAQVCPACGAQLADDQMFCVQCGAPRPTIAQPVAQNQPEIPAPPQNNVCTKCGKVIVPGHEFCPNCGQKVDLIVDNNVNAAINKFNASVEGKKKKKLLIPIIAAVVAVVCLVVGIIVANVVSQKNAEEAKKEYLNNVNEYLELSYTAAINLEDVVDTIQTYWHENIWEDKHGNDINDAIYYAMIYMSDEIDLAESYDKQVAALYTKISRVPDEVADEDRYHLESICKAVKDLHDVYNDFYNLATDPSGSYNSYSESNRDTTDEYLSCYEELDDLVN